MPSATTAPMPSATDDPPTRPVPDAGCAGGVHCEAPGMPFVRDVFGDSDAVDEQNPMPGESTTRMSQPAPGKVCMSGRVNDGYVYMTFGFATFDGMNLRDPLDAAGLGIARIQLTLESPPAMGVYMQLSSLIPDCDQGPVACQHWGFFYNDAPGHTWLTNQAKVLDAPLADFVRASHIDPTWEFDPAHLATFQIGPGALANTSGDYEYCISNLKFLDAAGQEVREPAGY